MRLFGVAFVLGSWEWYPASFWRYWRWPSCSNALLATQLSSVVATARPGISVSAIKRRRALRGR